MNRSSGASEKIVAEAAARTINGEPVVQVSPPGGSADAGEPPSAGLPGFISLADGAVPVEGGPSSVQSASFVFKPKVMEPLAPKAQHCFESVCKRNEVGYVRIRLEQGDS